MVELLLRQLNFDPSDVAEIHAEHAEKFLEEGKALLDKDPVQASEKLYKAAEEAVKAAAYRLGLSEVINKERGDGLRQILKMRLGPRPAYWERTSTWGGTGPTTFTSSTWRSLTPMP